MMTEPLEDVVKRARSLKRMLQNTGIDAVIETEACESQIGGGSLPLERIPSMAVTIKANAITTEELEERMRRLAIPVIGRTVNDKILLDARTLDAKACKTIAQQFKETAICEK